MRSTYVSMLCVCLIGAQSLHGAKQCGAGFGAAVNYGPFNFASATASADLNRDGRRDLIVAATGSGTISVLLGDGNGGFTASGTFSSGTYPGSMAVGDFNRDGHEDVAVPNEGNGNVRIFLGNGTGALTSPGVTPAGASPRAVRAADFNRDGKLDLAVVNTSSATVTVNFGVGDGTFMSPASFVVPSGPWSLTVTDVNLDGVPDVLVPSIGSGTNVVSILFGVPGGTPSTVLQSPVSIPTGTSPADVAVGDLNRDGWPDLVVANTGGANVSVHLGTGSGTFTPPVNYFAGNGPHAVRLGDFNGDGRTDVVVTNSGGSAGGVNLLLGNGNGTLQPTLSFPAGVQSRQLTVDDFNADGRPDLAVPNAVSNDVSILLGFNGTTATGGFTNSGTSYPTGLSPYGIATGDLNLDGKPDMVTANVSGNTISVLLGANAGLFQSGVQYQTAARPIRLAIADFNRDGKPDVAVASMSGYVSIHFGNGDGTFGVPGLAYVPYVTSSGTRDLAVIDHNRDGAPDIMSVNEDTNTFQVLLNNGTGSFSVSGGLLPGRPQSMASGDFNRDGIPDVAVGMSGTPNIVVLLGNGSGFVDPFLTQTFSTTVYRSLVAGDFNRDGRLDLLAANSQGTSAAFGSILFGNGDGTFQSPINSAVPEMPMDIAMADFDSDGKPDFMVSNSPSQMVQRRGDGLGGFTNSGGYTPGGDPRGMAIADFNGDGRLDIAVVQSAANSVRVLHNLPPFPAAATLTASNLTPVQGDSVTFTVTVSSVAADCEIPAGNIYFQAGAIGLGTVAVNTAGVATVTTSSLPLGTTQVLAVYRGNTQFREAHAQSVFVNVTSAKTPATLTLSGLSHVYDGSPKAAIVTTSPAGLGGVIVTYDGASSLPVNPGSYLVVATLNSSTYEASPVSGTLVISKGQATLSLTGLSHVYDGTAKQATVATSPAGLGGVAVTYDGSAAQPVNPGSYAVLATLNNTLYDAPPSSGTLVISKAPAVLALSDLSHVYDGNPKQAVVTTNPTGLAGVTITYNGSATPPVNPGNYAVQAMLTNTLFEAAPVAGSLQIVDATAPSIANITLTPNPAAIGTPVTLSASVSDAETGGSLIASADYSIDNGVTWLPLSGDFNSSPDLTVTAALNLPAGVYAVCVRASDSPQNTSAECAALLVVYDPAGGFVTGGGWIESPLGAFTADPGLAGKANFGFSSKYLRGSTVPSGETQFRFQVAGLQFKSTSYDWLVVSGARAQFKGAGTVNGAGEYGFMLTAIDGQVNGGTADRFRIKIWDRETGTVVYDNQLGKDDQGNDATEVGGGSIIIHKP